MPKVRSGTVKGIGGRQPNTRSRPPTMGNGSGQAPTNVPGHPGYRQSAFGAPGRPSRND